MKEKKTTNADRLMALRMMFVTDIENELARIVNLDAKGLLLSQHKLRLIELLDTKEYANWFWRCKWRQVVPTRLVLINDYRIGPTGQREHH